MSLVQVLAGIDALLDTALAHHPHWHIDGNAHDTITFTYLPTGRTHHSRPPRH